MDNYVLGQSWGRANVQDRLWYAKDMETKEAMLTDPNVEFQFADKVLVMSNSTVWVYNGTTLVEL